MNDKQTNPKVEKLRKILADPKLKAIYLCKERLEMLVKIIVEKWKKE